MKTRYKTLLISAALLTPPLLLARNILTTAIESDYFKRLENQSSIADRLRLPEGLSQSETDALKFLYSYMATPDVLDYDSSFYLSNIRMSLLAADEMPWGKDIPDREWRHFVLPVRVNNENLDMSREAFYEELKPRVQNLTIKDAILEINHWCHEKVSYQPSDARTSSPLATVANALGRCGEESTFTVAALRSVGIPARQVYTPRWAHTDDNHAWVEAWADGQWYFLGACEPEPVLNLAWFNEPASRGMLMTTKVTGAYDGPEEKLETTPITTIINVTDNYAPTTLSTVFVTDKDGKPLENVEVRFSLYNYAEFYPLSVKKTDKIGKATFRSGLGDMVVWASDGKYFNLQSLTAGDTLNIILDKDSYFTGTIDFNLTPPKSGVKLPMVSPEAIAVNEKRKTEEDNIRLEYTATFLNEEQAKDVCKSLGINEEFSQLLVKSRGNHDEITGFLYNTPDSLRHKGARLLSAISEKDLHDVTTSVLNEQLKLTTYSDSTPLFVSYVLNPRVELEMLRPFRQSLLSLLTEEQKSEFKSNPMLIKEYLDASLTTDSLYNPGGFRQSPVSTVKYSTADALNRDIAFVAICRSLGIPARIDPVSHITQFTGTDGKWMDVVFENPAPEGSFNLNDKSELYISDNNDQAQRQPKYYSQFSISRITDGKPQLMEFDDFETLNSINDRHEPLLPGQYVLVSGQRMADGSVLARAEFFTAKAGEKTAVPLVVRHDDEALQVIGNLDAEQTYTPISFTQEGLTVGNPCSILSIAGRGYYVLGIIKPGHEPSSHALNDIAEAASEIESTGRKLLILFTDENSANMFRPANYGKLPENVVFGIDTSNIAGALQTGLELTEETIRDLPIFVVADSFNRIIYLNHGYSIHLGETLASILLNVD